MTTKKRVHSTDSREAKRARFAPAGSQQASPEKPSRGTSPLILVAGLAIGLVVVAGLVLALAGGKPAAAPQSQSAINGDSFGLPVGNAPAPAIQTGSAQAAGGQPGSASAQTAGGQAQPVEAATLGHDPYPLITGQDGAVRLPLSTFDDGKAHFYTFLVNGKPIEFFVVKASDGQVRAAFNACDVCFSAKRGYLQDGDVMVCQNCGSRFPLEKINFVRGGCNPSPLTRTVVGDTLVILESDLAQGAQYF
jgi:hypothetical protein